MSPRTLKLPHRSFKVKFKIFRFGFTDFDMFVRHFTDVASWGIESLNKDTHTYALQNEWNITLHPHGDISLYSPLLKREQATQVYHAIDVLIAMDVRIGENCEVEVHYDGSLVRRNRFPFLSSIPPLFVAGTALALFLGTKTAQMTYLQTLLHPVWLAFEAADFILAVLLGCFLYKGFSRNKERFEDVLLEASREMAHEDFMHNEDIRRKTRDPAAIHAKALLNEISFPLENIMAYTRFYSSHSEPDTQHWKDLKEIMEQTVRMREVMNRVEIRLSSQADLLEHASKDKKLFRKSLRSIDLIPLVIHGTDLLGESFKIPSYTLNISKTGLCLLLPDGLVAVGQTIELHSPDLTLFGVVRWVVEGKTGNMMFAGVEFDPAKPRSSSQETATEPAPAASC